MGRVRGEGDLGDSDSSERDWCLARRMVSAWLRSCIWLDDKREACKRVEVRIVICFCRWWIASATDGSGRRVEILDEV